MSRAVGMDLGTTYSSVAVMRPEGRPVLLPSIEGGLLTPSVVLFTDTDDVLVGNTAKNAARAMPERCVEFVKRHMGEPHWRFVDPRDREYTAQEISAFILRRLAADASQGLGEQVRDTVITVPAYFDDARRKATREAGEIAGLRVLRLINEPTAAAIAFGLDANASGTILVYDLGGGTFDVTLMHAGAGDFEVIGTDGDRNLGGFDFDNALMRHVAEHVRSAGGPDVLADPAVEATLRELCEEAKRRLTVSDQAPIFLTVGADTWSLTVTRAEFDDLTRDLLYRTEVTVAGVLDDAGLTWADVDHLLLVGGSTRMRMVREMLDRVSGGKHPSAGVNPDEAVSLGAAVVAESASAEHRGARALVRVTIRDVTSHSLGVTAIDSDDGVLRNSVVIPRNTRIPVKEESVYYTLENGQRLVDVEVTECGDVSDDRDLSYVTILGTQPIRLTPGLPENSPLKVVMAYDVDGIIHVELIDLTNQVSLGDFELQRPGNLSPAQVTRMQAAMSSRAVQ